MFKPGTYEHENGVIIKVDEDGDVYLLGRKIPLTMRLLDVFDSKKWKEVKENGSKDT